MTYIFKSYHLAFLIPIIIILITLGSLFEVLRTKRIVEPPIPWSLLYPDCNISPLPDNFSKTNVRQQMTELYSCSIGSILKNYPKIDLEEYKKILDYNQKNKDPVETLYGQESKTRLAKFILRQDKTGFESKIFQGENYELFFWSESDKTQPKLDNFEVHAHEKSSSEITHSRKKSIENMTTDSNSAMMILDSNKIMAAPFTSPKAVILKVNNTYSVLTYKEISILTGFNSPQEKLNFVLLQHKLIGLNSTFANTNLDQQLKYYLPLIFLNDYQFSNSNKDETLKFSCLQKYEANLKVTINANEISYFAHTSKFSSDDSLVKIKIKNIGDSNKSEYRGEVEQVLLCGAMILC